MRRDPYLAPPTLRPRAKADIQREDLSNDVARCSGRNDTMPWLQMRKDGGDAAHQLARYGALLNGVVGRRLRGSRANMIIGFGTIDRGRMRFP
jgi:hypothetical protein